MRLSWMIRILAGGCVPFVLMFTMMAGLILGMGMASAGVYITLSALVIPALVNAGINLYASHFFPFFFGVFSSITPPVCLAAFAAAGIAAPGRFFAMLSAHDIEAQTEELGDHFDFHTNPFKEREEDIILITGKDAVKCRQRPEIFADKRVYFVEYLVDIDPYLVDLIEHKLKEKAIENGH